MRGHWKAKPTYTWEKKHINKWMAIPAIDMKVTAKKAIWHYVGYLPKGMGFNHKKHVLRMADSYGMLKGHGPFGSEVWVSLSQVTPKSKSAAMSRSL